MRDLQQYANECKKELAALKIPFTSSAEFTINTRAASRWGQTRKTPDGYKINISAVLLDERNAAEGLKNTIIHELLHTCAGCMNHGAKWKEYAARVKAAYGYNIKRTSNEEEKGIAAECVAEYNRQKKDTPPRYVFRCKGCGAIVTRQKASDFVQHPELYRCGICKGKFDRIG